MTTSAQPDSGSAIFHDAITEEWLKEVGFKWHQFPRQGNKQWLLWLGDAVRDGNSFMSYEDLGIEIGPPFGDDDKWFCFLRSDAGSLYSRFIHLRHIRYRSDVIEIIQGITGQPWDPANNLYGGMRTPDQAARIRKDNERIDRKMMRERKWREIEKDDTRGGALPEHLEAYEKAGLKDRNDL
jgi:hypothetical protein